MGGKPNPAFAILVTLLTSSLPWRDSRVSTHLRLGILFCIYNATTLLLILPFPFTFFVLVLVLVLLLFLWYIGVHCALLFLF